MAKNKLKSKFRIFRLFSLFAAGIIDIFKIFGRRNKETPVHKFSAILREEEREVGKLVSGREDWGRFRRHSFSLLHDYFIPHPGNGHRPKILHSKSLITIAALLLVVKAVTVGYLFLAYPHTAYLSAEVVSRVLELVNRDRVSAGVPALTMNETLSSSALAKANDLIVNDYFAHTGPDGKRPWDWIDRGKYQYLYVGENLAMNFTSAESVHQALMNSPSHKKNILNERYQDVGIAMVTGDIDGKPTNVLVEHFAVRKTSVPALAVVPDTSAGTTKASSLASVPAASEPVSVLAEDSGKTAPLTVDRPDTSPLPPDNSQDALAGNNLTGDTAEPGSVPPAKPAEEEAPAETLEIVRENPPAKLAANNASGTAAAIQREAVAAEPATPDPSLESDIAAAPLTVPNPVDDNMILTAKRVRVVNYFFLAVLALMVVALAINIFIRIEIQHKHVIIQTMILILFIAGLAFFKFHMLESGDIMISLLGQ